MQPKLWPDLRSLGAQLGVLVREEAGRVIPAGLVLRFEDEGQDADALMRHGFVLNAGRSRWEYESTKIDFSALREIVPGFDPAAHMGTAAPMRFNVSEPESGNGPVGEAEHAEARPESNDDESPSVDELGYRQGRKVRSPDERIEDYGEKIGGAKKDTRGKGGRRQWTREDFAGRTAAQLADDLSLTKLWPFSYALAKEQGMDPRTAAWVMGFRREMAPFSKLRKAYALSHMDADEAAEAYAQAVTILSEAFSGMRTVRDFKAAYEDLRTRLIQEGHIKVEEKPSYYDSSRMSKSVSYETKIGNLFSHYLIGRHYRFDFFDDEWREGREPRGYDFASSKARLYSGESDDPEVTEAQWEHLLARSKRGPIVKREGPGVPDRPHLDSIAYEGWPMRREGDVSVEEFASAFGFRAVEFGEWLPQSERQVVLNMAYDALLTQAEIMGLPATMMSLEGRLAAAFGSRGNGGRRSASAHYEPSTKAFNLTRINGAGSLAHEFGHAVDHWLEELLGKFGPTLSLGKTDWAFTGRFPLDASTRLGILDQGSFEAAEETARDWAEEGIKRYGPMAERALLPAAVQVARKMAEVMDRIVVQERIAPVEELMAAAQQEQEFRTNQAILWAGNQAPFKKGPDRYAKPRAIITAAIAQHQRMPEQIFGGEHLHSSAFPDALETEVMTRLAREGFRAPKIARYIEHNLYLAGEEAAKVAYFQQPEEVRSAVAAKIPNYRRLEDPKREQSPYLQQARRLDDARSSPYWATLPELFARAFESWIFDEVCSRGRADYLVHGVEESRFSDGESYAGNPYPCGEQRRAINAAMHGLMGAIAGLERDRKAQLAAGQTNKQAELAI